MIKRVNFTGRRRIARSRIAIDATDGPPRRVTAAIDLAGASLSPDAAVVLEATSAGSNVVERIECGMVHQLRPPTNYLLREVEGENVYFTLKVIDRQERIGRILGIAEYLRPDRAGSQSTGGRRGILPIEPHDLGQELWRLEFKDQDVVLYVNDKVPELKDRARSDPLFYAAVYPQVVRHVLAQAIKEDVDIDEDEDRWPVLWLRFGRDLHPTKAVPPGIDESDEDQAEWIDEVVAAFAEVHKFKDKYLSALVGNAGGES